MLFLLFILTSEAQESEINTKYSKETHIDFESIDITGEMIKPQGSLIAERSSARFNPLIELRTDWDLEMSQSVQSVK